MTVGRYYEVAAPGSLGERLVVLARDRIYSDFLATCFKGQNDTILDVGVSDVLSDGANVLERRYPYRDRLTACGLGEAKAFRAAFPEVRYRQISPGAPLPFPDKSFDIATANAVLEHVGGIESQRQFVGQMARVAHRVFISVPHRFFPVEHHTALPLAHWTDSTFRLACKLSGKTKWADERELRLMSRSRLGALVPKGVPFKIGYTGISLGPFSSNLFLAFATA